MAFPKPQPELVSVVIPAYNAETTLARTLASVRAQTYENLEIVVVDDGSTDGTRALAEAEAAQDPRIRILAKPNGGVAEARNAGIRASRGGLVAPVDADDLWHPEKIAKQVAVMTEGGPEMGFVYTYFRRIDAHDTVIGTPFFLMDYEGHVFLRHLLLNFVGNGSSLLMRREAFESAGGYEPELQRQGAQGCEDYLLQLLIARTWTVGVVREHLTGYRWTPGAMSSQRERMYRSFRLMYEHVRARHPEVPGDLLAVAEATRRSERAMSLVRHERRPVAAVIEYARALGCAPAPAIAIARSVSRQFTRRVTRRYLRRRPPPSHRGPLSFLSLDPTWGGVVLQEHPLQKWLASAAEREENFFREASARSPAPAPPPALPSADTEARRVPEILPSHSGDRR